MPARAFASPRPPSADTGPARSKPATDRSTANSFSFHNLSQHTASSKGTAGPTGMANSRRKTAGVNGPSAATPTRHQRVFRGQCHKTSVERRNPVADHLCRARNPHYPVAAMPICAKIATPCRACSALSSSTGSSNWTPCGRSSEASVHDLLGSPLEQKHACPRVIAPGGGADGDTGVHSIALESDSDPCP